MLSFMISLKLGANLMSIAVLGQKLWPFTLRQENGYKSTKNKFTIQNNWIISKNDNGRALEFAGIVGGWFTIIISP